MKPFALVLASLLGASALVLEPARAESPAPPAAAAMWDLSDLYRSVADWQAAYEATRAKVAQLDRYKGTLARDPASMRDALLAISALRLQATRLQVYASLQGDEDLRVAPAQERRQLAQSLATSIDTGTSWLAPQIIAIGSDRIESMLAADAALREHFDFFLRNALRSAPHTLDTEAESVLAASGDLLAQPNNVFQQLTQAELPFPTIALSDGGKIRLDTATYTKRRADPLRADRKAVFDAFWGAWKGYEGTLGANMTTQVMGDVFGAQARHFNGALEAAMFGDNMPPAVYTTLVAQANEALPTLHRYLRLRRKVLGIADDLAYYDNYPPLYPAVSVPKFDVEQSKRIALAALAPMGEEYLALLKRGFSSQWMNGLPRQGKSPGAYQASVYGVHPYLLLNHNDDYLSLSTLAHEWGHAVHSMLADAAQPFEKSGYSTFIAESASIANEMLLADYMVEHATTKQQRLYYLGEALEAIRQTFFRQVQFAEFQLQMHLELEQGRPLSGERLTQLYCGILRKYYGEAEGVMKIDPLYCAEWEQVPHFYYGYYVYQYATSMAGAAMFTDAILKEGAPARDRFLALLKAGGSDYPYELYKRAGLDMATPAPYRALAARMNAIMDRIEALQKQP